MLIEGIFCFIFPMPLLETRINSWQVCSKISTTTTKSMVTVLCKVVGSRIMLTNHKEITSWAEQSHTRDFLWVLLKFPPKNSTNSTRFEVIFAPEVIFHWRSSECKFNIWVWSNKWLLRYSHFYILRSSSFKRFLKYCFVI